MKTVVDIIQMAGGRTAVSRASRETPNEVTYQAVAHWEVAGIPVDHWQMIMDLTGLTVDDIFKANQRLKKSKAA